MEKFNRLKSQFEGELALYWEHGFWLVRVSNIQLNLRRQFIEAVVLCSPLPGLELCPRAFWIIGGGYLTRFSRDMWLAGYGTWTLYFNPELISGTIAFLGQLSETLSTPERYREVLEYMSKKYNSDMPERVFPDPPVRS